MTRILSIDPSSNKINTSTTGVVLLDNAHVEFYESVKYGSENFKKWWNIGRYTTWNRALLDGLR